MTRSLLLTMLALSGCAQLSEAVGGLFEDEAPRMCNSGSPCGPGERCVFGNCSDLRQSFDNVGLVVNSSNSAQQFATVQLDSSTDLTLAMNRERLIPGRFQTTEDKGIPGRVFARLTEPIQGHALVREAEVDDEGRFQLNLTAGSSWTLEFSPSDDALPLPPPVMLRQILQNEADGINEIVVTVPSAAEHPIYTGRFVDANGLPLINLDALAEAAPGARHGLRLRLVDERGRSLGAQPTLGADGRFSIMVHPDRGEGRLLLLGSDHRQNSVASEVLQLSPDEADLGDIVMPFSDVLQGVTIVAEHRQERLELDGEVVVRPSSAKGLVSHRFALDDDRDLTVELPIGDYELDIIPEQDSGFSPAIGHRLEVRPGGTQVKRVRVDRGVELEGTLVTPEGAAVAGATVRCDQVFGSVETLTDSDGRFELSIHRGAAWITALPSQMPRVIVEMSVEGDQDLDLVIDEGVILSGLMMRADAETTLGNARITVLAPNQPFDLHGKAVVLGEGVANSEGMFSIALPPF